MGCVFCRGEETLKAIYSNSPPSCINKEGFEVCEKCYHKMDTSEILEDLWIKNKKEKSWIDIIIKYPWVLFDIME